MGDLPTIIGCNSVMWLLKSEFGAMHEGSARLRVLRTQEGASADESCNRSVREFAVGNPRGADTRAGTRTGADQDSREWRMLHRRASDEGRAARTVSAHARSRAGG